MSSRGSKWTPERRAIMASYVEPLEKRILDRIEPDTNGGCWLWTGAMVLKTGYGTINYGGRSHGAHRISYQTFRGPIPAGMLVCHRCDTPACVNPAHLFLGTVRDNAQDMVAKGRGRRNYPVGAESPGAKLTEDEVRAIRAAYRRGDSEFGSLSLGRRYRVNFKAILDIAAGRTWAHLT